jgi:Leucine-rich repeat (LRR) protein
MCRSDLTKKARHTCSNDSAGGKTFWVHPNLMSEVLPYLSMRSAGVLLTHVSVETTRSTQAALLQFEAPFVGRLARLSFTSLRCFAGCASLKSLDVHNTEVSNLKPISGCHNLEVLALDGCKRLQCIKPIAELQLRGLSLATIATNQWLPHLVGMTNSLQDLCLANSTITNIDDLALLTELRVLDLSGCDELTDLSPLGTLTTLSELDLSECYAISDFSVLSRLRALKGLNLIDTSFAERADLSVLRGCTALETLLIQDLNPPADTDEPHTNSYDAGAEQMRHLLPYLPHLKTLYLGKRYATNAVLAALAQSCPTLETLDLSWGKFTDITPILALPLKSLSLCGALYARDELWAKWLHQLALLKDSLVELDLSHSCTMQEAFGLPRDMDPPILPLAALTKLKTIYCEDCGVLQDGDEDWQEAGYADSDEMAKLKSLLPGLMLESGTLEVQLPSAGRARPFDWTSFPAPRAPTPCSSAP